MDQDITTIIADPAARVIQETDGSRSYSLTKTTTATVKVRDSQISDRIEAHKANVDAAKRAIVSQQEIIDSETVQIEKLQGGLDILENAPTLMASKSTP